MAEYSGWTNYETWNVNLWVMNDYNTYILADKNPELIASPDLCREFVLNLIPVDVLNSILRDIHPRKLDDVNWQEIYEAWNEK